MLALHNHSHFSALDGFSTPEEIAARVDEIGMPGCFLTDHGTVAGFPAFRKAMAKRDLFAGYGMEAYQARDRSRGEEGRVGKKQGDDAFHLILAAKNYTGFKNLLRLSDWANREGFYYRPRVDWEMLEECKEGLIATTACIGSLMCQELLNNTNEAPISRMQRTFRDDFFIELHTYDMPDQRKLNKLLIEVAKDHDIPVVYANDAHYAQPWMWDAHEAFLAAQLGSTLDADKGKYSNAKDPTKYHPRCLYIMSEQDVRESLSYLDDKIVDEAIANSDSIMEMCKVSFPDNKTYIPRYKSEDPVGLLMDLTYEGIVRRYGEDASQEIWDRAEYELKALIDAELHDYFLIVWDYVKDALEEGIFVGPGRGSVGGSIVAYALGFSNLDPIKYDLPFERFWNPGRAEGMPDVDIDFEQAGRSRVLEKLRRKYGEKSVIPVGNHQTMYPKAAITKAAMVYWGGGKSPYLDVERIKDIAETTEDAGKLLPWDETEEALREDPELWEEWQKYENRYPDLFDLASVFDGRLSTYGVHASAVVIADADLTGLLPGRMANDKEADDGKQMVTQYEMHAVEDEGFVKFDLLRIKNLDVIMRTAMLSGDFK